ncbi:hypothetical protein INR49_012026 [Caranx melampygus]|nr:hypothetical protein INR49_012026 [Caranx melampygus]
MCSTTLRRGASAGKRSRIDSPEGNRICGKHSNRRVYLYVERERKRKGSRGNVVVLSETERGIQQAMWSLGVMLPKSCLSPSEKEKG